MEQEQLPTPEEADAQDRQAEGSLRPVTEMLAHTSIDLFQAFERASLGISSLTHQIDNRVVFILDNHQEVSLRVRKIAIEYVPERALDLKVHCRTDFENVLILAKKLNMRIAAFATNFTVILSAEEHFLEQWNEAVLNMDHPARFFETLDELKRPIFLNLNHYIISRISD